MAILFYFFYRKPGWNEALRRVGLRRPESSVAYLMKDYNPPLMTPAEEQQAKRRDDESLFTAGIPAALSAVVERTWAEPYMLMRNWFGESAEAVFEPVARTIGKIAGVALKPVLKATAGDGEHKLEATLKATRFAENLTGIIGEDFYVNENKVVRRVHTCPFKNRDGAKILCHLGEAAGQELFSQLVPGTRHKVQVTMARGHGHCEYSYESD